MRTRTPIVMCMLATLGGCAGTDPEGTPSLNEDPNMPVMQTGGPAAGDGISIRSGLKTGDLIVASGASALQPGMRVRPLGRRDGGL